MAISPIDGKKYYFVDKCLPFGAAISCALFQAFSDAVAHIVRWRAGIDKENVNYLDDFLFIALLKALCQLQLDVFMDVCQEIKLPISVEKTMYPTTRIVFLGLLIDTIRQMVFLPVEKISRGKELVQCLLNKKKVTVKQLQKLCGFLNFLGRAIVPGCAFTRRFYSYTRNKNMQPHFHVKITKEMRLDLEMWDMFLSHSSIFTRPFLDFSSELTADVMDMFSDASRNPELGMGATFNNMWCYTAWEFDFISKNQPSIEYLELYALVVGVVLFGKHLMNKRIVLFCDNESVVSMVNSTSSCCKNCMILIRILVWESLTKNIRVFARHIKGSLNYFSDSLSRLQLDRFKKLQVKHNKFFKEQPESMPDLLWPMSKLWVQ